MDYENITNRFDADVASNAINISLTRASDVPIEAVQWLWDGWLARAKFNILAGEAGTGKTTISMSIAAVISNGGSYPDGNIAPLGSVLCWSGEDGVADTLIPRLKAAGADLNKVHFINDVRSNYEKRNFNPATDMPALVSKAASIPDLSLLILDPIVNAVVGDGNSNNTVRNALQPVVEFAEKTNCAVLGITHFTKGSYTKNALDRVTGSLAYAALARIVLGTAKIDDGDTARRIFFRIKSNLGKDDGGYEYSLNQLEIQEGINTSYVSWGAVVEGSANEMLAEQSDESSSDCVSFLEELLLGGRISYQDILREGQICGFSRDQLNRAKRKLNIKSHREGFGEGSRIYWDLPPKNTVIDSIHSGQNCAPSMLPMGRIAIYEGGK